MNVRLCGRRDSARVLRFEAGQSCVGDHFAWFAENCVPCAYIEEAESKGVGVQELLTEKAGSSSLAKAASWRSTGGTATGACWWMSISRG